MFSTGRLYAATNRKRAARAETAVGGSLKALVRYDQWHPEIDLEAINSCRILSFCLSLKGVNGVGCHGFLEPVRLGRGQSSTG
jgi:hypothetical protein